MVACAAGCFVGDDWACEGGDGGGDGEEGGALSKGVLSNASSMGAAASLAGRISGFPHDGQNDARSLTC